jgi:hypothetical protein
MRRPNSRAITPTVAWNNLCLQAEIYRVNPDNNGQVLVSKKPLQGIEERAVAIIGSRPLKGLAIGALLSGASTTALMLYLAAPIALVALGGTIALVVGGYATSEWTDYRNVDHGYVRPEVLAKVERKLLEADLADHDPDHDPDLDHDLDPDLDPDHDHNRSRPVLEMD